MKKDKGRKELEGSLAFILALKKWTSKMSVKENTSSLRSDQPQQKQISAHMESV
jgi:hypothetical protein